MHSTHHQHLGNTQGLSDRNSEGRLQGMPRGAQREGIVLTSAKQMIHQGGFLKFQATKSKGKP